MAPAFEPGYITLLTVPLAISTDKVKNAQGGRDRANLNYQRERLC